MMNLLLGVQSTFDLSKVDFSSGLGINSPDLAGISFLMVIFAGVLALRLGTTLRDSWFLKALQVKFIKLIILKIKQLIFLNHS